MRKFEDLTDISFGYFNVVKRGPDHIRPTGKKEVRWLCKCHCGNKRLLPKTKIIRTVLTGKGSLSCGCMKSIILQDRGFKHGHCKKHRNSREMNTYYNMRNRCYKPYNDQYENYGGRGIIVCDQWLGKNGFVNFLKDMGPKPRKMSLERINVNGNYTPENCKWATFSEQTNNTRVTLFITYKGKRVSITNWGRKLNISDSVLKSRYHQGWSQDRMFKTPPNKRRIPKFYFHPHLIKLRAACYS